MAVKRNILGQAVALLCLTVLSGCGSDKDAFAGGRTAFNLGKSLVRGEAGTEAAPLPGRAELAALNVPVIAITLERRKQTGVMAEYGRNGDVVTFASADQITVGLRDGVLLATRGLQFDLMSAMAPRAAQLGRSGAQHMRHYSLLDSDNQIIRPEFSCVVSAEAAETIEIFGQKSATRRMRETCDSEGGTIRNDFWFAGSGKIVQSRQWVSPGVGYVLLQSIIE